ncbi:MAG: efflux RND transporter permease subunit, partial [candidate division KSB1 bacterium]|nr:efflux RND transporter permease subunit [candidate division KSB1 bacterium]
YPEVTIAVAYDQARFISNAISNVIQNIILGGLLAFLVLFFFLHDFRSPFNIALSMPISVIATFSLLYFTDVSLNIMSLGGLALGVGMLVDNSIVVLENIFRHRQEGRGHLEAAVDGTREVAMPVLASTLTTIAVFLPVVYVYGVAGQLFRDQALTVTFSLLASLLVALTLLPMLTCHFVFRGPVKSSLYLGTEETLSFSSKPGFWHKTPWRWLLFPFRWIVKGLRKALTFLGLLFRELFRYWLRGLTSAAYRVFNPIFRISDIWLVHIAGLYEKTLLKALNNRLVVIGLISGVMALAILLTPLLDRELMPQVDQGEFAIKVKMPLGSSLEATAATVAELEGWLLKQEDVTAVFSTIGIIEDQTTVFTEESGLNRAQLQVRLKEGRKHSTAEIMALIREQGARLALAEISFETGESVLQQVLGTAEPPVAVKIQGEDLDVCQRIAHQVRQRIKDVPGLKDLHTNLELGRPEYRIEIDREAAGRYGLSVTQLADFIQNTMKGRVATQFKDFDRKIDILVRPTLEQRDELADLLNAHVHVSIPTSGGRASKPSGQAIPLRELIRCTPTLGPSEIRREDQVRQVVLYGNLQGRSLGAVIKDINKGTADVEIPYDYRLIIGGEQEEVRRSFRSLVLALILAVLLIYMILAAQFESLRHPFVILLDVPITASCLMLLLFMTGLSVNVITLIGLIVLAGIAVNDSIIKVDFINQRRREGMPMREAILDAGQKRLRPILMTSVTTILGLLPMAIGLGEGAELQRPLAVTLIGGLFFSTMVTLFAVPVVYSYLERK